MAEWAAKRFWQNVTCTPEADGFAIHLDGRPVRTPAKTLVIVPTQALAQAIAQEWEAQDTKVNPLTMPHTRSANAALDKVAPQRDVVQAMIADYAGTDLLCYRAPGPERLTAEQNDRWNPILAWAKDRFGAALETTSGVMPIAQPTAAQTALTGEMAAMSDFELVGFHDLVSLSGSFVLALAVAKGHITPDEGWALSRLDENWQAAQWGEDEDAAQKAEVKRGEYLHANNFMVLANR